MSLIEIAFGLVIVCVYAHDRFNTPASIRFSTTRMRYHAAFLFYLTAVLLLFLMFSFSPNLAEDLPTLRPLRASLGNLSAPLAAALLLSVLLPRTVELKRVDEWILARFHSLADYPHEVRRLRQALQKVRYVIRDDLREGVNQTLKDQMLDPADGRFSNLASAHSLWRRLVALRLSIEEWKADRRYRRLIDAFEEEIARVTERYAALELRAGVCLDLIGRIGSGRRPEDGRRDRGLDLQLRRQPEDAVGGPPRVGRSRGTAA